MSETAAVTDRFAAKREWLAKVLGVSLPPPGGKRESAPSAGSSLQDRQRHLLDALKQAAATATDPERRAALREATLKASEASMALRKQDAAGAAALFAVAERLLAQATSETGRPPPADAPARWQAARQAWQAASAAVDAQISALQSVLRASNDDELKEIAEYGLNGVTGNFKAPLMTVMAEIDGGSDGMAKAAPKALPIIRGFRNHIETDEAVLVCDENPLGVAVSIRATLGPALAEMETVLSSALGA